MMDVTQEQEPKAERSWRRRAADSVLRGLVRAGERFVESLTSDAKKAIKTKAAEAREALGDKEDGLK